MTIQIRNSLDTDISEITRIYAHWVLHGLASFELEPPGEAEMARRRKDVLDGGFPYIVAVDDQSGAVLGYAYAGLYRSRPAYRFSCEDSVYISPSHGGLGIGRLLMTELIAQCATRGFRLMVAVIGDSGNEASIRLHRSFSFQHAGLLPAIGWKHNRWVDSVLMTRVLGEGSASPPQERIPRLQGAGIE